MKQEHVIIENLKDAGCDSDIIQSFLMKWQSGKAKDGFKLLAMHRCSLLEALHQEQQKIDCLDYLVYQLQRSKKEF